MHSGSTEAPESGYLELAYSSIRVFADDGTLDEGELDFLLGVALRDNRLDGDEKRVLGNIFDQAEQTELSPAMRARIRGVRRRYSI